MKLIFLIIYLITITLVTPKRQTPTIFTPCPDPGNQVPNGGHSLNTNKRALRVICRPGYKNLGPHFVDCVNGKWSGQKPICAKAGCNLNEPNPNHGQIHYENSYRMTLSCFNNFKLAGNRITFCNGTHWDRPIGNCREPNFIVENECDFETEDICGWVYEEHSGTHWRRVTAIDIYTHYQTGPSHDHTFSSLSNGHYMLMETLDESTEPRYLLSPIYERDLSLKTVSCFRFYYFMYGSGVGELNIYVRPVLIEIKDMMLNKEQYLKFHKSGNQNNLWNEGYFSISELKEDFQIIIGAEAGKNHLNDIAIDDVKLMTGENCTALEENNPISLDQEDERETTASYTQTTQISEEDQEIMDNYYLTESLITPETKRKVKLTSTSTTELTTLQFKPPKSKFHSSSHTVKNKF